jgi:very-short-patch-repair endonuclease
MQKTRTVWQPRTEAQKQLNKLQREAERSQWEDELQRHLLGITEGQHFKKQRFHPTRKWEFDRAHAALKIAIEVEGGTWSRDKSGHTSGKGYRDNCIKYNVAQLLGWIVLRFTSDQIKHGDDIAIIEQAILLRMRGDAA